VKLQTVRRNAAQKLMG